MKTLPFTLKDLAVLAGIVMFFFGCIASSNRTARTLDQGQVSFSGSYLRASDVKDREATPVQLFALDGRVGVARGLDLGFMHTWDISENNDGRYSTVWGDFKIQLTNRDNLLGEPILSLGLMKGYVYPEDSKLHSTTFPVVLSIPLNEYVTPTLMYRHELISNNFIPESFSDPRSTFSLGLEINLVAPARDKWTPKIGFCVGTFNSLTGGDGDRGLILNVGLSIDSPLRSQ